jgi:hypothetical protein
MMPLAMAGIDIERTFKTARARAAEGQVVIVRPDWKFLMMRPSSRHTVPPQIVAAMEQLIPPHGKRNVAVIGDTSWGMEAKVTIGMANLAIPFFGLLTGLAAIGHAVWIFGGASEALDAGCCNADVLIVDSASLRGLRSDWRSNAAKVMRNPSIVIHDRRSYKLHRP